MSREQKRLETKRRLYEAALEVVRQDGVHGARIEAIADRAGASRAAFYFHFPTREAVLVMALEESEGRVGGAIAALEPELPIDALLARVAELIAAEWQDDPTLFAGVGAVALRGVSATGQAAPSPVRTALGARFARAAERGETIALVPPQMLADLFLLNQFAVALAWSSDPSLPLAALLTGAALLFLTGAKNDRRPAP